jgi:hypothetical protein
MAGVNGESSTHQVAHAKGLPSVNLELILQNRLSTAPARLFLVDQGPITSAVNAKFGSVSKETAGNSITTQLESIAR